MACLAGFADQGDPTTGIGKRAIGVPAHPLQRRNQIVRGRVRLVEAADHVWGVAAYESRGGVFTECPEAYSAASAGRGEVVSCGGGFTVDDGSGVLARVYPTRVRVLEGHREEQSGNTTRVIRDGDYVESVGDASVRLESSDGGYRGFTYALTLSGTEANPLLLTRVDAAA